MRRGIGSASGGAPILRVAKDEGGWQLLCGGNHADNDLDGAETSTLGELVARDPSLNELADKGRWTEAEREHPGGDWTLYDDTDDRIRENIRELGCHVIDLVVGQLGRPAEVTPFLQHASPLDDSLMDNMLAVFRYPRALAGVKASAQEVAGFERRHLTVCGTGGTFHIQPLDNPSVRVALSEPHGDRKGKGVYEEIKLPKYSRYVDDAADMARVIRGEKPSDFSYEHDLAVQETVLRASGMWPDGLDRSKL